MKTLLNEPQAATATAPAAAWHLRAMRLPDSDQPEDWWVVDGRLSESPVAGARALPGTRGRI
ncbi:MAG: hypothetical protein KF753_06605 [Caldilineaceae bacterium]|nr:hypothetical protein [Caldilineaceae bacterium]